MASSRWKRFAFFEKHTLSLNNDVIEDLVPAASDESRRSLRTLQAAGEEAGDDSVSLVTVTAALPVNSFDTNSGGTTDDATSDNAMQAMWSSLTARTTLPVGGTTEDAASSSTLLAIPQQPSITTSHTLTSPTSVDGLVLAFVTSRYTNLIHCVDLTVRCNPPDTPGEKPWDLDGWRGYVAPNENAKIVGMSVCRGQPTGAVLLASITNENQIYVWEDPHLYLSCRRPLTTPVVPNQAKIYTPAGAWNTAADGKALSIDILWIAPSGFVAVGTTTGVVWIYRFGNNQTTLHPHLRIPSPTTETCGGVVSVKLAPDPEDVHKALVFCAYRSTTNTTQGGGGPMAGICCFEMTVSGRTTTAAPLARHDLDGRSVAFASLVDSFGGNFYTVVRLGDMYAWSHLACCHEILL